MSSNFNISNINNIIKLEKDDKVITIGQYPDNDMWFNTSLDDISFDINFNSRNFKEWQTYIIFENLIRCMVGKYVLSEPYKNELLPKDFIDIENKKIIWHSDSGLDNVLTFEYLEDVIRISINSSTNKRFSENNYVRIRTDGSEYGTYYQEFLTFFRQLTMLTVNFEKVNTNAIKQADETLKLVKKNNEE